MQTRIPGKGNKLVYYLRAGTFMLDARTTLRERVREGTARLLRRTPDESASSRSTWICSGLSVQQAYLAAQMVAQFCGAKVTYVRSRARGTELIFELDKDSPPRRKQLNLQAGDRIRHCAPTSGIIEHERPVPGSARFASISRWHFSQLTPAQALQLAQLTADLLDYNVVASAETPRPRGEETQHYVFVPKTMPRSRGQDGIRQIP